MPRRHAIWILITLAMAVALLIVWRRPMPGPTPKDDPFGDVRHVYDLIRKGHYDEPDEQALRRGAVRGMVETLDEFSVYIPPSQARQLNDRIFGTAEGLGLRLDFETRENLQPVTILGVVPDSPADDAGIEPGSRLMAINKTPVAGLSQSAVEALLETQEGAGLALQLTASGEQGARTVSLEPARYEVQTIEGLVRDDQGQWRYSLPGEAKGNYIRIREFCPQTPANLQRVLRSAGPFDEGLVLDLRDNPGGLLEEGIAVAEMFLDRGEIVTVTARGESARVYTAHDDTAWGEVPLVVLVNGESASAAELLAGALAANARAILIGTRTHGKGCVQSLLTLGENLGQISLTSKVFRVVPERPIQRHPDSDTWGVDPHIHQPQPETRIARLQRLRRLAEVLRAPRPTGQAASQPDDPAAALAEAIISHDAQLKLAVEILSDPQDYARRMKIIDADVERARRLREKRQDEERETQNE